MPKELTDGNVSNHRKRRTVREAMSEVYVIKMNK